MKEEGLPSQSVAPRVQCHLLGSDMPAKRLAFRQWGGVGDGQGSGYTVSLRACPLEPWHGVLYLLCEGSSSISKNEISE